MTPNDSDNDEIEEGSDSDGELENIWSCDDFSNYLQDKFKDKFPDMENIFKEKIYSQMKHYVKSSTLSV